MPHLPSMQELTDTANVNVESFQSITRIVADASEQMIALNADATRLACTYVWANASLPFDGRIGDEHHLQQNRGIEQATEYFRKFGALCVKTQSGLSEVNSRHASVVKDNVVKMIEAAAQAGPAGTSDFVAAWKSALSNATLIYENLVRMGRESVQTNLAVATVSSARPSPRKTA